MTATKYRREPLACDGRHGRFGLVIEPLDGQHILGLDPAEVASDFRSEGLLLFRSFEVDIASLKRFTELFATGFMSYAGGASSRSTVGTDATVMSVSDAKSAFAVPLHGEMYYSARKPRVLWFYCVRPAERDGQTTVADAAWMYRRLAPATRALLEDSGIRYVMRHAPDRWQSIFQTTDLADVKTYCERAAWSMRLEPDGTIVTDHVSRPVWTFPGQRTPVYINNIATMLRWERLGLPERKVRLKDGARLPSIVIDELCTLDEEAAVPVDWKAGDVLMVDNTRFMHGRRAFTDLNREIYVRMAEKLVGPAA